jgi:hypothetical protein
LRAIDFVRLTGDGARDDLTGELVRADFMGDAAPCRAVRLAVEGEAGAGIIWSALLVFESEPKK